MVSGTLGLLVLPDGSNREWMNIFARVFSGTPHWSESETDLQNE